MEKECYFLPDTKDFTIDNTNLDIAKKFSNSTYTLKFSVDDEIFYLDNITKDNTVIELVISIAHLINNKEKYSNKLDMQEYLKPKED